MKDSEALYELVHALSKNEKRYFKLYCSGLSGRDNGNYLALFTALEKQKEYDGAALKKALHNPAFVKNLSAEKNYLFNLVLDSLLAYHREQPEQKIRTLISKAHLLFDKGLIRSSSRLLVSARKLARTYGNKGLLLDIISLQSKHFVHLRDVKLMKEYVNERYQLAREIQNESRYSEILAMLVENTLDTTYMRDPGQREKLDALMKDELMQDESKALSLQAKLVFYNIRSFYYYFVKSEGHLLENNRRMLQLFEENPGHTSINLNDYLSVLSNFAADALQSKTKEDITYVLNLLEEFPKTYEEHISPVVFENYRHLYLETFAKINAWLGEFEKIISLLPELKAMAANKRVLKPHRRQSVSFSTSMALFACRRYKETLRLLQEVEDIHEAGSGSSYLYFMQIMFLRLMTHYEIGNVDVVEEQAAWLRQFLVKQNKLRRSEDHLLSFFAALSQFTPGKATQGAFRKEYELQLELMKDAYEYPFLGVMSFVHNWVKSKAEQRDFAEVSIRGFLVRGSN